MDTAPRLMPIATTLPSVLSALWDGKYIEKFSKNLKKKL